MRAEIIAISISLFVAMLAAPRTGNTATFCVSTGTQLANALNSAESNGQSDEIRITTGILTGTTAPATNPRWSYRPGESDEATALNISGGWSAGNNCISQSVGVLQSQLDAEWLGPVLNFGHSTASFSGQISIRNLTLARGRTFTSFSATGIQWFATGTVASQLLIENTIVTSGLSNAQGAMSVYIYQAGSGTVRFRNNIVSNNNIASGVSISTANNAIAYVSNNSIFGNEATTSAGYGLGLGGVIVASNNAVADNTTTATGVTAQVYATTGSGITLRNNHFEDSIITGGAFSELGTTTGDPMWTAAGMLQIPNDVSPLRDSGVNNPSGGVASTDIDGNPRIIGSLIDRGAVEAEALPEPVPEIFENGFE